MPYNHHKNPESVRAAYNIICWAEERGLDMNELADCTGVPYTYLPRTKRDALCDRITLRHLESICRLFGKEVSEIFV